MIEQHPKSSQQCLVVRQPEGNAGISVVLVHVNLMTIIVVRTCAFPPTPFAWDLFGCPLNFEALLKSQGTVPIRPLLRPCPRPPQPIGGDPMK